MHPLTHERKLETTVGSQRELSLSGHRRNVRSNCHIRIGGIEPVHWPVPSLIVVFGCATAFFCLSLTLRMMPLGIAYAMWAGLGTALIVIAAYIVFQQVLDGGAIAGIALILAGVAVVNLFRKPSATEMSTRWVQW